MQGYKEEAGEEVTWREVSHGQTAHLSRISALSTCPPIPKASFGLPVSHPFPEKQSSPGNGGNAGRKRSREEGAESMGGQRELSLQADMRTAM